MQNGSKPRRAAHWFLNSKGGVGKTTHAVYLVQGLQAAGLPVTAIDADPTSASFAGFRGLGVRRVNLMEGDRINARIFDDIVEEILTQDMNFVIDTGASGFVELNRYLTRNGIPDHIVDSGKSFVANVIVTGGATFNETSLNLKAIAEQAPPSVEIVVWLNGHFGPVAPAGRRFEDLEIYQMTASRIKAVLRLEDHTFSEQSTFGADVKQMMSKGLSFNEVRQSPEFTLMAKARLHRLEQEINGQLSRILAV
jgi:hypothetical protein